VNGTIILPLRQELTGKRKVPLIGTKKAEHYYSQSVHV